MDMQPPVDGNMNKMMDMSIIKRNPLLKDSFFRLISIPAPF